MPKTIYLTLGSTCNQSCSYCTQGAHTEQLPTTLCTESLHSIFSSYDETRVIFFGGEPLIYFNTIKEFVAFRSEQGFKGSMGLITNGRLLTLEVAEFCNRHNISVTISHDSYAQHRRETFDPLLNPQVLEAFLACNSKSISCVVSVYNADVIKTITYFSEFFKPYKVQIPVRVEFLKVTSPLTKEWALSSAEEFKRSINLAVAWAFTEDDTISPYIKSTLLSIFTPYLNNLQRALRTSEIRELCGVTNALHIDVQGVEHSCHNVFTPGTPSNKFFEEGTCLGCPALLMCGGGCSVLPVEYKSEECFVHLTIFEALQELIQSKQRGTPNDSLQ